ncbi:hypothetical protein [Parapedobacter tibetensis]|nr:hypothetical protein [Parapedobacter tibetensis]
MAANNDLKKEALRSIDEMEMVADQFDGRMLVLIIRIRQGAADGHNGS